MQIENNVVDIKVKTVKRKLSYTIIITAYDTTRCIINGLWEVVEGEEGSLFRRESKQQEELGLTRNRNDT